MSQFTSFLRLQSEPIEIPMLLELVEGRDRMREESGALLLFCGQIRKSAIDPKTGERKEIRHLEYEAHLPLAQKHLHKITEECGRKMQLHFCACVHRIGITLPEEKALLVISTGKHREEVYAANRQIVERIKYELPIWKKELYVDGTYKWAPPYEPERKAE